jgi:HK97 family phage portal protein
MTIFGLSITRARKNLNMLTRLPTAMNGWLGTVRESFAGAWQRSVVIDHNEVRKHNTVWACQTLIASDIAKLAVNYIERNAAGIWEPKDNPAYSPVLRKPNHYQNRIKFFEQWVLSKLGPGGNTYVLLARDKRGVVVKMFLLDPTRVTPLVAQDGSVFYRLATDHLSGLSEATIVPASEIIHDVGVALYHPLCGLSPIVACALAATQGLKIQEFSAKFFENDSMPGGVLTAPASISNDVAARIQQHWDENFAGQRNIGKVAVLGDGLKYEPMTVKAVEAQLIDQLKWGDEKICAVHHVPAFMVGVGPLPAYNDVEPLNQQYYSQCLQIHIESIELCLDEGLGLRADQGVEFDIDNLIRMDSTKKMKIATDGIKGAVFTPNFARKKYYNLPPMVGGDALYLQQQNYSLEALAKRDAKDDPFGGNTPPPPAPPEPDADREDDDISDDDAKAASARLKSLLLERTAA